jgi:hypothetical protein
MSKAPTYGDAVRWLVEHTDLRWVPDPEHPWPAEAFIVSDLWGVNKLTLLADVRAMREAL